ncbi:MAG TPA: hypothetical protein VKY38_01435 [Azoarcus sp.]|nr:hypothetical protein [Azoarcus sp.]
MTRTSAGDGPVGCGGGLAHAVSKMNVQTETESDSRRGIDIGSEFKQVCA